MKKVKTILMGTPEFAERIFSKFYSAMKNKIEIIAVITAPDKPVGRKQELISSPLKKWAQKFNLNVLEPNKIRDPEWIKKIQKLAPELIILCAYGQIIPKEILDIPKHGALNIHPSLLPQYRGASPIQTAILNGDKETGVTLMLMDEEMDHGDIISNFKFKISNKITYEELEDKLIEAAIGLLIRTLPGYVHGEIQPKPQDHSKATFCKIIKKEDGKIDWNKSAEEIERQIRAYAVWPTAYTEISNFKFQISNKFKILNAEIQNKNTEHKVGEVFLEDKNLAVQTGDGVLILKQVQLEGKKPMPAQDFLNGHPEIIGSNLE
jgi:methionyl-tRNA formyltransferase